jgi:hypothetical protein
METFLSISHEKQVTNIHTKSHGHQWLRLGDLDFPSDITLQIKMEAVLMWSISNVMDTFESRVKSIFMHWNYPDVKK